jgi:hypothetical protein
MKATFDTVIHLLHEVPAGTLATHSVHMPGYPFATALPFAPDERHRPIFLISGLAEHTKNLLADARASFLVASREAQPILAGERLTLVGDVARIDASAELLARFLRYHPEAEQYVALGDFAFFQLTPKSARHIAGFGEMGWIDGAEWANAAMLPLTDEALLYQELVVHQRPGVRLLGVDSYGVDIERGGKRERQHFAKPLTSPEKIGENVRRLLSAF